MMKTKEDLLNKFIDWQNEKVSDRQRLIVLSIIIGLAVGLAAVIIKNLVHLIRVFLEGLITGQYHWLYIVTPTIGIAIAVVFIKYINRRPVRHGIPGILYAISKNKGHMNRHNLYSSIITSALTVGFGGSVGLEGPTVATGGAIGSQIGQLLKLDRKQITLLLGCACAGAMASIFKAPVAAIVFALEVIMLDLTMSAIVPLLISSVTAALTGYLFWGQNVLYSFTIREEFILGHVGWYILFGIFTGLVSVYFTKMYMAVSGFFESFKHHWFKLLFGGLVLGIMVFIFPSLYGEGYEVINECLNGDYHLLFEGAIYERFEHKIFFTVLVLFLILILKVIATSVTFGAGGVGGIFAPSLFTGAIAGLLFAFVLRNFGVEISPSNFALVGMAGMIAAVIHAPLTAIFLIAEITGGYELFMPLMLVAT
ncbi:MAG: chloride channel protein, partial [Bacteroidales bacterium]|nr:chloride channel protein [Bacteroidales bacterium]